MKKNFNEALFYVINKNKNKDNCVGDFCRDSLEYQYKEEMEDPCRFFNFILEYPNICTEAKKALDDVRKIYNRVVDDDNMKVLIDRKESKEFGDIRYAYKYELYL